MQNEIEIKNINPGSIADKMRFDYFPKDATHYDEEFFKYAEGVHNNKVLVWRGGEWLRSSRTYLPPGLEIKLKLSNAKIAEIRIKEVKQMIEAEGVPATADFFKVGVYTLEQICRKFQIELPKARPGTIFGDKKKDRDGVTLPRTPKTSKTKLTIFG